MARLRDVGPVLRSVGLFTLIKRIIQQISEDNITTLGAAMAYSWLFAIFPFLVFLLSLVPFLPPQVKPGVRTDVARFVDAAMPQEVGSFVKQAVDGVLQKPRAGGFLGFGVLFTIWAASKGMATTMTAIDRAYDVDKNRPFYKQQPLAILLTAIVATMVVLVMILLPVGSSVLSWLINHNAMPPHFYVIVNISRYIIALMLLFAVLAIIYHFGPNYRQKFVAVTPGAVFSVAVWLMLGVGFRLYLSKLGGAATYNRTYGALAGAAILLLFFYIDALVLLIGAEINSEIDFALTGKHGVPAEPVADAVPPPADSVKPS